MGNMITVTSKDNEIIKLIGKLNSAKKFRREFGLFVVEGVRICEDAIKENAGIYCGLVSESACERYPEIVSSLSERAERFCVISDELSAYISDTASPQGVFAVCRTDTVGSKLSLEEIDSMGSYAVLVGLQDTGNLGTILRTADALGIDGIITVGCCDLYNPKTVRSTMGSLFRVNVYDASIDETLGILKDKNIETFASVIDSTAESITGCGMGKDRGCAVLIGNEGNGLDKDVSSRCDRTVTIKMHGNVNSLNAASAASILLWELVRGRG